MGSFQNTTHRCSFFYFKKNLLRISVRNLVETGNCYKNKTFTELFFNTKASYFPDKVFSGFCFDFLKNPLFRPRLFCVRRSVMHILNFRPVTRIYSLSSRALKVRTSRGCGACPSQKI